MPVGPVGAVIWPGIFSPDLYVAALRRPNAEDFIEFAIVLAILFEALVIVLAVPFWKILHASNPLKFLIAGINVLGAWGMLWITLLVGIGNPPPFTLLSFSLVGMSMAFIAAAMFSFENELSLREAKRNGTSSDGK